LKADSLKADSLKADSLKADSLKADSLKADSLKADSLGPDSGGFLCSQCGESIEPDQEIVVKSLDGTEKKHYHKDCFKLLWV
jgi:hypothetical protein